MKALLLALGCSLLYAAAVTVLFRRRQMRERAAAMLRLFLATVPVYLAAYAATPADLGVLAPSLVEPRYVPAGAFGLFVHAALFFGGWWQVYNLADRGCALHIVLAICESPERTLTASEIEARYGAGRGLHWMPDKRIDDILDRGLATLRDGRLHATPKGARVARLFGLLRTVLRLDGTE